jgi:NADPH2:quinone reductase
MQNAEALAKVGNLLGPAAPRSRAGYPRSQERERNTMRSIQVFETGDPSVLKLTDIPIPQPGPGQVRIKIAFAGLNFIDTYQRSGMYKLALPFIPGGEAAGVVDAVGPGVEELHVGQPVAYGLVNGAYAEFAVVPATMVVPIPEGVSMEVAVALMVQGMTAHYLATSTFPLLPGNDALIHAAAGGTGRLLVQVAKRQGATVIATAGSHAKAELAKTAGADHVIVYTEVDFEQEVKLLTNGRGVDVVYDSVGKSTFLKGLNCLRMRGYMVLWGQASGTVDPFDPQILNQKGSLYLTRPSLGAYIASREELLTRANEAHRYIEGRKTMGKVLLEL